MEKVEFKISKIFTKEFNYSKIFALLIFLILGVILNKPYAALSWIISFLFWVAIIVGLIYIIVGARTRNWWSGFQKYLLIISIASNICNVVLEDVLDPYLINYNIYGSSEKYWHLTVPGQDKLWIRLKLNANNTYSIWMVKPNYGDWLKPKSGKLSTLTKQRFTDSGNNYYALYLEDYPFVGERTMLVFQNAFRTPTLHFNNDIYSLDEGDNIDPWKD